MSGGLTPGRAVPLLFGMLVLAAIPASRLLANRDREEGATARILREKRESMALVDALARQELACDAVFVEDTTDGMRANGCGKEAWYVRDGDHFRRDGEIVTVEAPARCPAVFRRSDVDAGDEQAEALVRAALATVQGTGHTARLIVPIEATGLQGFAKLRYGEHVDVLVRPNEALADGVPVPCPNEADASDASSGTGCKVAFHHVSAVEDCP